MSEQNDTVDPPRRGRRALASLLALAGLAVAIFLGAWQIDESTRGDAVSGEVAIAGRSVANMDSVEVESVLSDIEQQAQARPLTVRVGADAFTTTAGDLGLMIDRDSTVTDIQSGTNDDVPLAPVRWALDRFDSRQIDPVWDVDEDQLTEHLDAFRTRVESDPIEPTIEPSSARISVIPGVDGGRLDMSNLSTALVNLAEDGRDSESIGVALDPIAPTLDTARIEANASQLEELTSGDIDVTVGSAQHTVKALLFRSSARMLDDGTLVLDEETTMNVVAEKFAEDADPGVAATFEVVEVPVEVEPEPAVEGEAVAPVDSSTPTTTSTPPEPEVELIDEVRIISGTDGTTCCNGPIADLVVATLKTGERDLQLDWITTPPENDERWATSLNIDELVGEFTTNHSCCQNRVHNIHTMADAIRGMVIEPGEMFSLNEAAGRRTTEGGYKSDGVIYNGEFTKDVGGGVSQFSTTLFNAAFFAGLEYGEYQSHSRIISRYPYGRETTLSFPAPDLQIINNTPDGILIWPEYTENSITVKLYGTQFATGEQTGRYRGFSAGWCRVTTERTRTFVTQGDRTEIDNVTADYRDRC